MLDNVRVHESKAVQAWLAAHPRFVLQFTAVHGSWMHQVERCCSILQRKRLAPADLAAKTDLEAKIMAFITEHNEHTHPLHWTTKSVAKVMAWAERRCQAAATAAG